MPWLDYALLARFDFSDKKEPQQQPSDLDNYLQQVQQRADYLVAEKYKEIKSCYANQMILILRFLAT